MPSIGVITFELRIDHARSLKDKRHYVACVTVSPDQAYAEQLLQAVEREAAALLGGVLVGATVEWLS
jgi:uncharacterized protein YlxP (DUF503 family)